MGVGHVPCKDCGMDHGTRYAQALSQAEVTLGGRAQLAAFFQVSAEKIAAWLAGEEVPPLEVFLGSLDVIADGPYAITSREDRKSTRLNSSHQIISYAVFCLKKKNNEHNNQQTPYFLH